MQSITSEEFNSLLGVTIIPKVIERKNNILFAGNIKYDVDDLDETYLNMDFRAFSTGDGVTATDVENNNWPANNESGNRINPNLYISSGYDVAEWKKPSDTSKIGGEGENIQWQLHGLKDTSIILNKIVPDDNSAEIALKVSNSRNQYNSIDSKSLAHDEIYRYGIILYSKYGTKYPTKWVCDIRTPNVGNKDID
ncbi:hypothetical protein [Sharpea azabuensis]|uniref:hypothetical protein n=1 Tax=Sharpea azabuensis TaxID=322505 RepID=UPI0015686030|nr:hypothetical protein [Sharpea azabuensis]